MNNREHHCTQKLKVCTSYRNQKGNMHIRGTIKEAFFIYAFCLSTVYVYGIISQSNNVSQM